MNSSSDSVQRKSIGFISLTHMVQSYKLDISAHIFKKKKIVHACMVLYIKIMLKCTQYLQ